MLVTDRERFERTNDNSRIRKKTASGKDKLRLGNKTTRNIPIEGFKKILVQRKQKQHAFKDDRALLRRTALFVASLRPTLPPPPSRPTQIRRSVRVVFRTCFEIAVTIYKKRAVLEYRPPFRRRLLLLSAFSSSLNHFPVLVL